MSSILDGLVAPKPVETPDGPVMDFHIERHVLQRALSATASTVANKDLQPVLKNFHFRLSGTDLRVSASNGVMTTIHHAAVLTTTGVSGEAVLPAHRMSTIVAEAVAELHVKVLRKKEKYFATIKSGSSKWQIPLMSPGGFPDLSAAEGESLVEVERLPLLSALQRVRKAVSVDPLRPYLEMIAVSGGKFKASDSIRFQQTKFDFPFDCQIPSLLVHELVQRLTASKEESIKVGFTKNALLYRFGKTLLVGQKVNAQFPDVEEVLLKPAFSNDLILRVSREELLSAVRRVRVTSDDSTSAVVLSLNHGSVSLESKDRMGGVSVEEVEADWEHAPRHVTFNHRHLTDLLSSSETDTCVFRLGKDLKTRPTAFLMEDEAEGFTAVLSQIRLDWM